MRRGTRWLGVALLAIAAMSTQACSSENDRWEGAQKSAEAKAEARKEAKANGELPKAAEGATLNKFFPADDTDGLKRSFDQEKEGFVQATFQKDGVKATLSVSDVVQNEDAKKKFADATEKLGDDPVTTVGKNQTTALIASRWQIKVSSPDMDPAARKTLLEKFDLPGLRAFNPPTH